MDIVLIVEKLVYAVRHFRADIFQVLKVLDRIIFWKSSICLTVWASVFAVVSPT